MHRRLFCRYRERRQGPAARAARAGPLGRCFLHAGVDEESDSRTPGISEHVTSYAWLASADVHPAERTTERLADDLRRGLCSICLGIFAMRGSPMTSNAFVSSERSR